jgi:transposase-like protein
MFKAQEKQRIVLWVLRGECTVAEPARRNRCSETSIAKWREQFVQGGVQALEDGSRQRPTAREAQSSTEAVTATWLPKTLNRAGGVGFKHGRTSAWVYPK